MGFANRVTNKVESLETNKSNIFTQIEDGDKTEEPTEVEVLDESLDLVDAVVVEEPEPVVESEPEPEPEPQPVYVPEPEPQLDITPNPKDSAAFQRLSASAMVNPVGDTFAELVESMVSTQCELSGVKNLDLTTFGIRAQVINYPNLSVIEYGAHKFLGAAFTQDEEDLILHRLGVYIAQNPKKKIVIRAVQEIKDGRGMSFYSLLFTDRIAQRFADMFNYIVHANLNEPDVSKLVLVIEK